VDKVDQNARPYVEKVAATTRPYTDAAVAKAHELVDKMDVRLLIVPRLPVLMVREGRPGDGITGNANRGEASSGEA